MHAYGDHENPKHPHFPTSMVLQLQELSEAAARSSAASSRARASLCSSMFAIWRAGSRLVLSPSSASRLGSQERHHAGRNEIVFWHSPIMSATRSCEVCDFTSGHRSPALCGIAFAAGFGDRRTIAPAGLFAAPQTHGNFPAAEDSAGAQQIEPCDAVKALIVDVLFLKGPRSASLQWTRGRHILRSSIAAESRSRQIEIMAMMVETTLTKSSGLLSFTSTPVGPIIAIATYETSRFRRTHS